MKFKAEIDIMPLKSLLDPQGKAVTASMKNIDLSEIENVRIGKHITLDIETESLESAKNLIENGCDKISINTAIFNNAKLIHEIASSYGSQAVVASLDVKKINNKYICFSYSGTVNTGLGPVEIAKIVEDFGAGEIFLTSIDNDGTLSGYDYELLERVSLNTKIPIIASGGAGKPEHMLKAIKECGVSAVAAASIFQFTEFTPNDIREFLIKNNVAVRQLI